MEFSTIVSCEVSCEGRPPGASLLKPDGFLCVHISNRYLDLQPVLAGEAKVWNKAGRVVEAEDDDSQELFGAAWVVIRSPQAGVRPEFLEDVGSSIKTQLNAIPPKIIADSPAVRIIRVSRFPGNLKTGQ